MAEENKNGFRHRKSTSRRSSILKQRQDTCFFSEDAERIEYVQTPTLKRRVSFASTTTVRTFEKQPLHLSDDSFSSGVTHNSANPETLSEDDVFLTRSFLLAGVNKSQQSNAPDSDLGDYPKVSTECDQGPREVNYNEQNKTIMFSEFNDDDDCAMEITANVSQLSSSWFGNENSLLVNDENNHQLKSNAMNNVLLSENIQPRILWSEGGDHEVEKTRIFLSSDDDDLEITRNLSMPPFISQRYEYEDKTIPQQNVPMEMNLPPHQGGDDYDMEVTGVIEEPPRRRSVLVDLTENKALTPIQEMSVSSSLSLSDEENGLQHKSLNLSRVCKKSQKFDSSQDCHANNNIENEPVKDIVDDPEVSFNFRGPSPRNTQVIEMSQSFRNELIKDSGEENIKHTIRAPFNCLMENGKQISQESHGLSNTVKTTQKTMIIENDESARNHISTGVAVKSQVSIKSTTGGDKFCQETTMFTRSMEITPHSVDSNMSKGQIKSGLTEHTVYMNDMEMITSDLIHSNDVWQMAGQDLPCQHEPVKEKTLDVAKNTEYIGDMEVTDCVSSSGADSNDKTVFDCNMDLDSSGCHLSGREEKLESVQNTLYLGDMELTSFRTSNKFDMEDKTCGQRTMDISVSRPGNISQRERNSEFFQNIVSKTDKSLSHNTSVSDKFHQNEINRIEEKPFENSVFVAEMELTVPNVFHEYTKSNNIFEGVTRDVELNCFEPEKTLSFDLQEEIGSLPISFSHNALGPQELDDKQSASFDNADELEMHDSISLSEIAGLKTPSKQSSEKRSMVAFFLQGDGSGDQDDGNSSAKAKTQEVQEFPIEDCSKQKLSDIPAAVEDDNKSSENTLIAKQNKQAETILSGSDNLLDCKSDNEKGKCLQGSLLYSDQDRKRANLRKSLCNELMFPNLTSERNYTKGLFQSGKFHTTEVMMTAQEASRAEGQGVQREHGHVNPQSPQTGDEQSRGNLPSERPESTVFNLASDFFEDGDMLDEDCPVLEDACDYIPLNESFKADQEELAFSYMRSIMETPGGQRSESKNVKPEENNQENLEFSDICHVMGIDVTAEKKQDIFARPLSTGSVEDRLNMNLFIKPEIATLESYVQHLLEESLRNQQIVQERLKKFSHCPSKTYINTRNAQRQGQDVSTTKLKAREMAKACKSSARGKHNRHKADYLMQLTSAQQTEHGQQKKDLDHILSDIERVANVSAEIDKCLEDLNTFDHTRSEIKQLKKKTEDAESETCKLRLHCDNMEKQIQEFNKSSKDTKHRLKEEEEEQELLLDKISFMACLSEWSLLKESKNNLTFGFLFNTIIVNVDLLDGKAPHQRISDISFKSKLSSKCCSWAKIAHTLMLSSLDRDALMNRYEDFSQINLLLARLSELASVARDLCSELKSLHLKHKLSVEGLKIQISLFSHEQKIDVKTTLRPGFYPAQPLIWEVNILMSPLSSASIVDVLNRMDPGVYSLTRSLDAVLALMSR